MRQWKALALFLVMVAAVSQAGVYQKAGMFFSMITTVTDYQFGGIGLQYEVGRGEAWGDLGVEFRASYDMYSDTDTYEDDRDCEIIPLEVGLKYAKPMGNLDAVHVAPYLSAGVGLYKFEDFTSYDYDDVFGYHGALGCEFYLVKQFGFNFQLKYTEATDDLDGNGFGNRYGVEGLGGDLGMFLRF